MEPDKSKEFHLYPPSGRQVSSFKQDSESRVAVFVVYSKKKNINDNTKNSLLK